MIPIVYFRSSSFNCHRFCPMQYYMEYTLGWRGPSNKKADKGTIVHKVLEICAVAKKAAQEGKKIIVDEQIGRVSTSNYKPEYLNKISSRVYEYYTSRITHHAWTKKDAKDCQLWVWKALELNEGRFDPRNRNVVAAEPRFDFMIEEDWAKYSYDLDDQTLNGNLGMKGTIDLVTDLGDGVYEMIDWKTGRRLDWATGKEKTQASLFKDAQLRIYHYAMKQMFPHVSAFIVTIIFINDGGAFTIHFQDKDLKDTEDMLKQKFQFIKNTNDPKIIRQIDPAQSWKCTRLCHQGMRTFEDTHVESIKEHRPRQKTPYGQPMTKCEQARYMIKKYGIDWVTNKCSHPDHTIETYQAPEEV